MKQQCEELGYTEVSTLLASDAEARDRFGSAAAVDGNRLIVGARHATINGICTGKVYVYDWDTVTSMYVEVSQLTASDPEAYSNFGSSVALSGTRLVVGANTKNTTEPCSGKVYVYDWDTVTAMYVEVSQLTASDPEAYGIFGSAITVSSSGRRLAVGMPYGNSVTGSTGKVYVYCWDVVTSAYLEVCIIISSNARNNGRFGYSVALSHDGTRLLVGTSSVDTTIYDIGTVYVYDWDTIRDVYVEVSRLSASDAQARDNFGSSLAVTGGRLVVGAYLEDPAAIDGGKVYVYNWNGAAYIEVATITAADAKAGAYFSGAVALSGDGNRLVVGAHGDDTAAVDGGKVYVYVLPDAGDKQPVLNM